MAARHYVQLVSSGVDHAEDISVVQTLLRQAATTLATEANGVTDNPLIFADTGEALSGGNFHAEPVAFAADMIALAVCEIGSLSERRTAMLVDPAMRPFMIWKSSKPSFLYSIFGSFCP